MKILIVEDDEILVTSLATDLASQNYVVESVNDGQMGWNYAQATQYDLIVLDVNLPKLDGITLCRKLRQASYDGSILLLTAEGDSKQKVEGLDAGADDYVVKPCPTDELAARIRALLRRPREINSPILQWGALQLDPGTCQVYFADQNISLSPKEYGLLELFLRNPQRVFSNAMLLERLWGFDEMPGEETIRSHIKRLRRKLKGSGADEVIENIYGMGYRLMPPPMAVVAEQTTGLRAKNMANSLTEAAPGTSIKAQPPMLDATLSAPNITTETAQTAARTAAFAALSQFRTTIADRLAILEEAVSALQTATLSNDLQAAAQQAAHKLVGSLGMFGLVEGSQLSQQIEISLKADLAATESPQIAAWINQLRQDLERVLGPSEASPDTPQSPSEGQTQDSALTLSDESTVAAIAFQDSLPLLLIISTDEELVAELSEIAQAKIRVRQAANRSQAQQQMSTHHPDIVLIDMESSLSADETLSLLSELDRAHLNLSVLALTHQHTFEVRLEIARRCGCAFLPRSTPIPNLLDSLLDIYQRRCPSTLHVLVVDDDPLVLKVLEDQLPPWGLQVTTIEDPRQLWDTLPQSNPDLLILDVEMPYVDGIELCRVIRSDRLWGSLPILFLTARRDAETVQKIYRAGADDYVAKPFTEPELVTRILNRIERRHLIQKLAIADPITGLIREQQALRDISRDLAITQRYRQPYCLAFLAVDLVETRSSRNQSWLYEQLICDIANILTLRLRQEDIVAQSSSNIFLLGMNGIYKSQAEKRLEALLQELHDIANQLECENAVDLSFRVGLAAAPEEGNTTLLLRQSAEANIPPENPT